MKSCAVICHVQHIVLTQENKTAVAPLLSIGHPQKSPAHFMHSLFKTISRWCMMGRD